MKGAGPRGGEEGGHEVGLHRGHSEGLVSDTGLETSRAELGSRGRDGVSMNRG